MVYQTNIMCEPIQSVYDSIDEYRERQETYDYVHMGIYPERLRVNNFKHYNNNNKNTPSVLTDDNELVRNILSIDVVTHDDLVKSKQSLLKKMSILEDIVKKDIIDDDCPICLNKFGDNFVSPSCGHKICITCFATTIRINSSACNKCCMCRRDIVSSTTSA